MFTTASKRVLLGGLLAFPAAMAAAQTGVGGLWGYEGEFGPERWGSMTTEFDTCASGQSQSPIDIAAVTVKALPEISVDYQDSPLQIADDGRTIQVNYRAGSSITVGDRKFELLQFHFHSPSEHTLGGKRYPLAVHLVHHHAEGGFAVIEVMMQEGAANTLIDTLWTMLPTGKGLEKTVDTMMISAAKLLPADRTYFSYPGSLTTPPCKENVSWMVMAQPTTVSARQIERFRSRYKGNSRPVQPLNQRRVYLGN